MATARQYVGAWGEATLSFLDHLLVVCMVVGVPALAAGVAGHHLLSDSFGFSQWLLVRQCIDLLLTPIALAAAMWMSREDSFFRPGLGEVLGELFANIDRLILLSLALAFVLRPATYVVFGLPLVWAAIWLLQPARWLEGGPLWKRRPGSSLGVLVASAPLWIGAPVLLWSGMAWDVWSAQESTPVMMGIDQVLRALAMTWGWAVLLRLYRVRDPDSA